jgi:hypothetical protein
MGRKPRVGRSPEEKWQIVEGDEGRERLCDYTRPTSKSYRPAAQRESNSLFPCFLPAVPRAPTPSSLVWTDGNSDGGTVWGPGEFRESPSVF